MDTNGTPRDLVELSTTELEELRGDLYFAVREGAADHGEDPVSVDECPVCGAPLRVYEDFCSRDCWDSWHYVNDPETWREANHR
jgi:hypothetical protein